MTTITTPSMEEMNEYAKKVADANEWKMPDSLEATIHRLASTLADIPSGAHPETIEQHLREFAYKLLMIAGVKII